MERYIAEPNDSIHKSLEVYKWRVFDRGEFKSVAYTVRRETAEDYANQMNDKGYIEVDE